MNLIEDKELLNIVQITEKLFQSFTFEYPDCVKETYWRDCEGIREFPTDLNEYKFVSPIELKEQLETMWEFQKCDFMKEYAVPLTIASFKNRYEKNENIDISEYIYEF